MAFATPPIASRSVPFLKLVRDYLKNVGTAQENRVTSTPFYWKSARFQTCASAAELYAELV